MSVSLRTHKTIGTTYDILDLDFKTDGVIDVRILAALQGAVTNAGNPNFTCTTNGQQCDSPDFNRDGDAEPLVVDLTHVSLTHFQPTLLASNCSGLW